MNFQRTMSRGWVTLAAVSLVAAGCGKTSSVTTVPISGAVTLDGKPLAEALVTLNPNNPDGKAASGRTDTAGQFQVSTFLTPAETQQGALPGDYAVTITKPPVGAMQAPADPSNMSKEQMMQMSGRATAGAAPTKPAVEIPPRYADPTQSGLAVTVASGGNQPLQLPLTTQ